MEEEVFITGDCKHIHCQPDHKISADIIISEYESKITKRIASKILSASKDGIAPNLTKEELLYLNKKSKAEKDDAELQIITPDPNVTLKKGNTELNIGHAVTLVQKMEEKYPTQNSKPLNQVVDENLEKATTQWKQAKIYTDGEYQTTIENPQYKKYAEESQIPDIKTVNKNAYEIREAILAHALDWVKFTHDTRIEPLTNPPTEDAVLIVAQKFYKFVENKR